MVVVSSALSQELIVNAPAQGSFVLRRDSCAYDRHTKTELLDGPKFLCLVISENFSDHIEFWTFAG